MRSCWSIVNKNLRDLQREYLLNGSPNRDIEIKICRALEVALILYMPFYPHS